MAGILVGARGRNAARSLIKPPRWSWSPYRLESRWRNHMAGAILGFPMWESAGVPRDAIGHRVVTVGSALGWTITTEGAALLYPSSGARFIQVPDFYNADDDPWTVLAVLRFQASSNDYGVFAVDEDGIAGNWLQLWRDENGATDRWGLATRNGGQTNSFGGVVDETTIYRVMATSDGTTIRVYVNGGLLLTQVESLGMTTNRSWNVGAADQTSSKNHVGTYHTFVVWDHEKNAAEVAAISADPYGWLRPARRALVRVPARVTTRRRIESVSRIKPARWTFSPQLVSPEWRWAWRNMLAAVSPHSSQPFDLHRRSFWTVVGGTPNTVLTPSGAGFRFNEPSRAGEAWQIPDSINALLEGRIDWTVGMYLRTNYGSASTDEDTLFGHWDNIDGGSGERKKFMLRWDSNSQQFELFMSANGSSDQSIGNFADAGFDDGELHTVVVVSAQRTVSVYRDAVLIGTGSYTGSPSSGANSHPWEFPGGHLTTTGTTDSPRVDLVNGFVSAEPWKLGDVVAYARDPFGPFRLAARGQFRPDAFAASRRRVGSA